MKKSTIYGWLIFLGLFGYWYYLFLKSNVFFYPPKNIQIAQQEKQLIAVYRPDKKYISIWGVKYLIKEAFCAYRYADDKRFDNYQLHQKKLRKTTYSFVLSMQNLKTKEYFNGLECPADEECIEVMNESDSNCLLVEHRDILCIDYEKKLVPVPRDTIVIKFKNNKLESTLVTFIKQPLKIK